MIRRISIAILVTACFMLVGLLLLAWRSSIAPIEPPSPSTFSAELVAKGEALSAVGHCAACHTQSGGQPFAGGYRINTPFGAIFGTNITPDPKTGIGVWSLEAFTRAMRDGVVGAALAAKAIGKPVKMVCTRADDMRFDCPRSPSTQVVRMAWGDDGRVTAMDHHAAAGWPTAVMVPFFMPKGANGVPYDQFSSEGANHWYTVGAQRVRALRNDLAEQTFRPGWLRSVGAGWTCWAVESFMDEAAHAAGVDPVKFRLGMLDGTGRNAGSAPNSVGGARRQAAVLSRLTEKVGWGKPTPKDVGLSIATTFGQERRMPTWTACAARVRVNRTNGHVTVEKLSLVIDAGTVIHPNSAEAQVEGAALWGLSMALHEGSEFVKGQPKDTNLDTYTLLRMGDIPDVEVEFLPSTEAPVGLGEPAVTPVAPAIANAIFAASGARVRHKPRVLRKTDGVAKRFRRERPSSNLFASGSEKSLLWVNFQGRALSARLAVGLADASVALSPLSA
jgi:hypothetical protein